GGGGVLAGGSDSGRDLEWRGLYGEAGSDWQRGGGEECRSGSGEGESGGAHCGRGECGDRVQGWRGVRFGEVAGVSEGAVWGVLSVRFAAGEECGKVFGRFRARRQKRRVPQLRSACAFTPLGMTSL